MNDERREAVRRVLEDFVHHPTWDRSWFAFYGGQLKVYLRKGSHLLRADAVGLGVGGESPFVACLDVASVEAYWKVRGTGLFTEFLGVAEEVADSVGKVVYVENVLADGLAGMLRRRGYVRLSLPGGPVEGVGVKCFYRPLPTPDANTPLPHPPR